MLEKVSQEFRQFFLLEFTKELIRSTNPSLFEKKEISPAENLKQELKKKLGPDFHTMEISTMPTTRSLVVPVSRKVPRLAMGSRVLNIPEPKLPPWLQDIHPVSSNLDIDLGVLTPLIRDPAVKVIECNGPDERIIVRGNMGRRPTDIILDEKGVEDVINRFSQKAKIPIHEGILRIAFGRLILTAIISEVLSPKFIIKKLPIDYRAYRG